MKKRKKIHYMTKSYKCVNLSESRSLIGSSKKIGTQKDLEEETRQLSLLAARYEVLYVYGLQKVCVRVRCRNGSKVYEFCKELGYSWS